MYSRFYCINVLTKNSVTIKNSYYPLTNHKIHLSPCSQQNEKTLDDETIRQLETLSLVNFENKEHIKVVEEAISFANKIQSVNTDNVEPLICVLEDE